MKKLLLALVATGLLTSAAVADKLDMKTGLWEMNAEIDMGHGKMPAKTQHCITQKDLDGGWFEQRPPGAECKKAEQKVTASTMTWTIECKVQDATMKATGKVNYTKTTFEGSAQMEMNIPQAGKQKGTIKMSGKYLGSCKK
jgi:hypothetical protein